jgi:hypothetical protein
MFGNTMTEESPQKSIQRRQPPTIRFVANFSGSENLINRNDSLLDRNFKNQIQDQNVWFSLIYKEPNSPDFKVRNIEAPSFFDGSVWDICFFSNPYVI